MVSGIAGQQTKFRAVESVGQQLADRVGPEDAEQVHADLADLRRRYDNLVRTIESKMKQLAVVGAQLKKFMDISTRLSEWLCLADNTLETCVFTFVDKAWDREIVATLRVLVSLTPQYL